MKKRFTVILCGLLLSFSGALPALALDQPRVGSISVEGNLSVPESRIISLVRTREGEPFSGETFSADLRRLEETGLFERVEPEYVQGPGTIEIILRVFEKPVIDEIRFEGNRAVADRFHLRAIDLEKGQRYDHGLVEEARAKILESYDRRGFRGVSVTPSRTDLEPGRAVLTFRIDEGAVNRLGRVRFEGNSHFSDRELARLMQLRPRAIHLFRKGTFQESVLRRDIDRIVAVYEEAGFTDASVDYEVAVVGRLLDLTLRVDEGESRKIGEVFFFIEPGSPFPASRLREAAGLEAGDPFSRSSLARARERVRDLHLDAGHLHSRVEARDVFNDLTGLVDISWEITPGPVVGVETVEVTGNTITHDRVIRREITLLPGELFSNREVRRSLDNIRELGYFKSVRPQVLAGDSRDLTRLVFEVEEEERTGSLMFGGGYSSVDGLIGQVQLRQRNFNWRARPSLRGAGQELSLAATLGGKGRGFQLSFTEPWLGDRPVSLGIDARDTRRFWTDAADRGNETTVHRSGGALRFGWRPEGPWRYSLSPAAERVRITSQGLGASQSYLDEEGSASIHSLAFGLTGDFRDSRSRPRRGTIQTLTLKAAGGVLGGDRDFWKTDYRLAWHHPLPAGFVLTAQTLAGYAGAFGKTETVPVFERYFVGGTRSVRGYRDRSLGPMDARGEPLGGNFMLVETLEAVKPLNEMFGFALFADAGSAWTGFSDFRFSDIKVGAGAGVRVIVPYFSLPIKLDWAFAVNPDPGQGRSRVHFDVELFSF